ncbi:hypothetical protein CEP51_016460 [Fusarium floridanum]|uniref:Heterokaryon incompatibility domain-containing protein n=1 Tax=Fusarium floridanum TaxID=1325733 RepID=A0A428NPB0_9HYPO|nr:hypothetical protein CEP51_016460 [Fusarium floridanum]
MPSTTHINRSKLGAADLCDGCLVVLFDDSANGFYEEAMCGCGASLTLRHVNESLYRDRNQDELEDEDEENEEEDEDDDEEEHEDEDDFFATAHDFFVSPRRWKDELPGLPAMAETADAGCQLCQFLRQALLRRGLSFQGPIQVRAGYIWGYDRDILEYRDDGLVGWSCEVRGGRGYDGLLSVIDFNIETRNGKCSRPLKIGSELTLLLGEMVRWLRMDEKRSTEPLDAYNIKWIKDKLSRCEEICNHIGTDTEFLPTRLIDIGTKTGDDARLICTSGLPTNRKRKRDEGHVIKYATLSYCWGPKEDAAKQVKTTKSNFSQHLRGMPLSYLSPVVRDAILVCKALDIRYLWVDALCIIQDDSGDWDRESEMMAHIYCTSFLTICPLSSNTCLEGFLGPRPQGLDIEFQSSRHKNIQGTYTFFENLKPPCLEPHSLIPCKDLDMDQSSWPSRGWTLQEKITSCRILFFGTSMCHISCESGSISENAYGTRSGGHSSNTRHMMSSWLASELCNPCSERRVRDLRSYWQATWEIQKREWTYRGDLLPAISGLAKQYALKMDDVYLAGLWKNSLHHDLTWKIEQPGPGDLDKALQIIRHQNPYVAPSWSWASQKKTCWPATPDTYCIGDRSNEPPLKDTALLVGVPCHSRPELTLRGFKMDLWGNNSFGRLKRAFIKVSGKVAPFPSGVTMGPQNPSWNTPPSGYFSNGLGTCQFDWSSEPGTVQQPGRMQLLLVSSCCAATSDRETWPLNADPKEDHERWHSAFMESNPACRALLQEDYVDSEDCKCCKDEGLPRSASGIVIHPAEEPGSFYRVGFFMFLAYRGGTNLFKHVPNQTIKLV